LDEDFNNQYDADKRFGRVFGLSSLLAILIACLGLFGLASFSAERRTREIGIRKVFGATSSSRIKFFLVQESMQQSALGGDRALNAQDGDFGRAACIILHSMKNTAENSTVRRREAESLRKMLLAMAEDLRVVFIKLADRLHNMLTLDALPLEKRRSIAQETLEIYAPLAHRLGIWELKWQLEDLSFRYLEPSKYHQMTELVAGRSTQRESFIEQVIQILSQEFVRVGLNAEVSGRPKHIYSIHQKMEKYAALGKDRNLSTAHHVFPQAQEGDKSFTAPSFNRVCILLRVGRYDDPVNRQTAVSYCLNRVPDKWFAPQRVNVLVFHAFTSRSCRNNTHDFRVLNITTKNIVIVTGFNSRYFFLNRFFFNRFLHFTPF
jgi:hypothetical protein